MMFLPELPRVYRCRMQLLKCSTNLRNKSCATARLEATGYGLLLAPICSNLYKCTPYSVELPACTSYTSDLQRSTQTHPCSIMIT